MLRFMLADAATWGRFALGSMLALGGLALLSQVLLRGCRRQRRGPLALRQALRSLGRPGSAAATIPTTLSAAMAASSPFTWLSATSTPPSFAPIRPTSPTCFFWTFSPISGRPSAASWASRRASTRGTRPAAGPQRAGRRPRPRTPTARRQPGSRFNLTYRDDLLEDEVLRQGKSLSAPLYRYRCRCWTRLPAWKISAWETLSLSASRGCPSRPPSPASAVARAKPFSLFSISFCPKRSLAGHPRRFSLL